MRSIATCTVSSDHLLMLLLHKSLGGIQWPLINTAKLQYLTLSSVSSCLDLEILCLIDMHHLLSQIDHFCDKLLRVFTLIKVVVSQNQVHLHS